MKLSISCAARLTAFVATLVLLTTGALAKPDGRPFNAKLVLTETVVFTGAQPCFAYASVQLSGTASHLGRLTGTSTDCINPSVAFDPSVPNSFSFSSIGSGSAGLVFTAANGDLVFATYSGTLKAQASGPHLIAGQFTITGGTGRFFGATGGGTLTGYEDISQVVSGRGEIDAVGTIVY